MRGGPDGSPGRGWAEGEVRTQGFFARSWAGRSCGAGPGAIRQSVRTRVRPDSGAGGRHRALVPTLRELRNWPRDRLVP